ncbi:unnamed protein product [Paramecium pentaurelia]|uniref:Uncharacterized protein n=1 Tax=Paramecium pentaurelia TaxID=43138 RepID=A0A8S1UKC1_9CILI|nr:unnamed protein product [Paramecium pentaurelia]
MIKLQLKLDETDIEILKQQYFEDIKRIESKLVKTLKQIFQYKKSL